MVFILSRCTKPHSSGNYDLEWWLSDDIGLGWCARKIKFKIPAEGIHGKKKNVDPTDLCVSRHKGDICVQMSGASVVRLPHLLTPKPTQIKNDPGLLGRLIMIMLPLCHGLQRCKPLLHYLCLANLVGSPGINSLALWPMSCSGEGEIQSQRKPHDGNIKQVFRTFILIKKTLMWQY